MNAVELTEADFVPQAECRFQHWGEREGEPYCFIRPLGERAAERVWARLNVPRGASSDVLDLAALDDWDAAQVTRWLLDRSADRDRHVLLCYQPRVVVSVPWRVVCEHWLIFFWTGACAFAADGSWVLVHDGDRFEFMVTASSSPLTGA